ARRRDRRAVLLGNARRRLPRRRARPRRRVHLAGDQAGAENDAARGVAPLPLLAPLPGAALRRGGARRGRLMLDPEVERKNMLWGWGLIVLFLLLLGGTVSVVFIYLAVD